MRNNYNKVENFNECFWAYIHLIIEDDSLLSNKGRIIKFIVRDGGNCRNMNRIARHLGIQKPTVCKILNDLQKQGCITLTKIENRKMVKFNEDIILNGLKIPFDIIEDKKNEY